MRFSIITPSLNQGAWIGENLRSVRDAAEKAGVEVEHFVIDGGSTDSTVEILAGQDFARWVSEPDKGQADAVNKGLARASGDILYYLCADDLLEPDALALVDEAFRARSPNVVYGDGYFLESDSGWKRRKNAGEFSYARLRWNNFLIQPAVFWDRAVYERYGGFDPSLHYCLDHEYWLRIGAHTRWQYLNQPLATSRLHADAKTSKSLGPAWQEACRMQKRYGITIKPRLDAWWMTTLGHRYYRLKRALFARVGHMRRRTPLP